MALPFMGLSKSGELHQTCSCFVRELNALTALHFRLRLLCLAEQFC
jgi:hypothetical protein